MIEESIPDVSFVPSHWIYGFQFEYLSLLSPYYQSKALACIRIAYDNLLSAANREMLPWRLYVLLEELHGVIKHVYLSPIVQEVAAKVKNGPLSANDPVDFSPEMLRDMGQYRQLIGRLIGFTTPYEEYLDSLFDSFYSNANMEPSIRSLFILEYELDRYRQNHSEGYKRGVEKWLDLAFDASMKISRYDRAASVALMCLYLRGSKTIRNRAGEHFRELTGRKPNLNLRIMSRKAFFKRFLQPIQSVVFSLWLLNTTYDIRELLKF